ncbi:hypothetical protein [uncultured Arcticibacterium sp.]|uniref:hypothetical protein n=1 Tax=uncultured Arcticibacterium sp. TaxID=2173042 RepID=UPI0030F4BD8A
MKKYNYYLLVAGTLNALTAILHLIGGQLDLVNPMLESGLSKSVKTQLLSVWHMVTIVLFATTLLYFLYAKNKIRRFNPKLISFISYLYILFSFSFIISSFFQNVFTEQWILLLPIGILGLVGSKKNGF